MKLKEGFLTHDSGGETVVVDAFSRFRGLAKGNQTAGFILRCLEKETTEEAIVDEMCKRYDAPRERIAADTAKLIEQLRSIGAIDE